MRPPKLLTRAIWHAAQFCTLCAHAWIRGWQSWTQESE